MSIIIDCKEQVMIFFCNSQPNYHGQEYENNNIHGQEYENNNIHGQEYENNKMAGKVRLHISFTVRDEAAFILSASNVVKASQVIMRPAR